MEAFLDFIHKLRFEALPDPVVHQAKRAFLDLVGVAAAGTETRLSEIVRRFAVNNLGAGRNGARILFDGRLASLSGAAYAGASTIDSFDAHDGHKLTKGHAGVAILPALLALADRAPGIDGRELLTSLVLGFEIATRAGIALHSSVSDYHTSGAWNALGVAAIGSRVLKLDVTATRHALGIAEYHGPRSQMMRCIDHPTMLKDGSGWGALAGMSAVQLAADGFSGAPAITMEAPEQAHLWSDLGSRWRMMEQYFKLYPVCRWAQPAVEAVAAIMRRHAVQADAIERVEIRTFAAGVRLGTNPPRSTEEAQYALGFPVAAYLVRGRIGADEVSDAGLEDPAILSMLERIDLAEDPDLTARFPAERAASAIVRLRDGTECRCEPVTAQGDPENPLDDDAIVAKFRDLARALDPRRARAIEEGIFALDERSSDAGRLLDAVLSPIAAR